MSEVAAGSALRIVIADSLASGASPELKQQQIFSDRTTQCRKRMLGLCQIPEAKGVVTHTRFDAAFAEVEKVWKSGVLVGGPAETAFKGVDDALDRAEAEIAQIIQAAEALKLAKAAFALKQTGFGSRAQLLVSGGFAKDSDFRDAIDKLQTLFDTDTVTGDTAEAALTTLDDLLDKAEKAAEKARLYTATLKSVADQLGVLEKNRYVPPDGLDAAKAARKEAETLAATPDYDGALTKLQLALQEIAKAQKLADEEKDVDDNRESYVTMLCQGSLLALNVAETDLGGSIGPEQFSELVKLEKKSQGLGKLARDRARKAIREKYTEYVALNAPEEEAEEDEAPVVVPVETALQKQTRIDGLKKQSKSFTALKTLDAENEIYRTYLVFANRGADFKVGNTGTKGDFVPDWVSGYEVMLNDGPPDTSGRRQRYKKMIVHFHFSDKDYTNIQRAHFKNNHGASDHGHVLIKSMDCPTALTICKRYL